MEWTLCGFDPGSDSVASQDVWCLRLFEHFVTPVKGCSIAEDFHFLHFLLDESYVRIFIDCIQCDCENITIVWQHFRQIDRYNDG